MTQCISSERFQRVLNSFDTWFQASSVWHCFTFDSCDNTSDMSIISMSSRPESLGRNVTTVILPGCDSPDSAKTVEIHLYCRPPNKELNRGEKMLDSPLFCALLHTFSLHLEFEVVFLIVLFVSTSLLMMECKTITVETA